ncbi:hypothetical protein [Microseira wollei]|uniref:Uncharacterized protein n=1 Tax=Microseira wollei NIES-4236 TaxID=2530354 RepID=A0AAV3XQK8_9CYAN|nr:hypothetical protein [Microseira wollei]GET43993.1 hypothetical protein MiSe_88190 [Microseira wollei NIES-4236]
MEKQLDETVSLEIAKQIKSQAKNHFDNAYKAALATEGAIYVQGFLAFAGKPYKPVEHAWIEVSERIIDPNLPHLHKNAQELFYFPAHRLTVEQLKAAVEEAKEDYPEDDPLPVYGKQPYEYYGDQMLGPKEYLEAYQLAEAKCKQLNQPHLN